MEGSLAPLAATPHLRRYRKQCQSAVKDSSNRKKAITEWRWTFDDVLTLFALRSERGVVERYSDASRQTCGMEPMTDLVGSATLLSSLRSS